MKKAWINGQEMDRIEIAELACNYGIPAHCCDSLAGYITGEYRHVGSFLSALLSNNLRDTFVRADDINQQAIKTYVGFLYNYAPSGCRGSVEKFPGWLN